VVIWCGIFISFPVCDALFLQKYRLGKQSFKDSIENSKDGIYLKSSLHFFFIIIILHVLL
jgi:hypothetical protein